MGNLAALERREAAKMSGPVPWLSSRRRASSGVTVNYDEALTSSALWCGVRVIAETFATVPLKLYRDLPEGGREPATDHPQYEFFHDRWNQEQTSVEARELLAAMVATTGNGYAWLRRRRGRVDEAWPIPTWRVRPSRDRRTGALVYRVMLPQRLTGGPQPQWTMVERSDMLHLRGFSSSGVVGDDVIWRHMETLGLALAAERSAADYFGQGMEPGGFLRHPGNPSEKAKKNIMESLSHRHVGVGKRHRVFMLEEGIEWQESTQDPERAQLIQSRQFSVTEVARVLNIQPTMLHDLSHGTFANTEQQMLAFVKITMRPWYVRAEQAYARDLLLPEDRSLVTPEHNIEGLLRGDSQARAQFYQTLFQVGGISPNEIAALENLNPVPGGDSRFVQLNMVPLGEVAEAPASGGGSQEDERSLPAHTSARRNRGARQRSNVRQAHERTFLQVAERAMRREVRAARRALQKSAGAGEADLVTFRNWMDEFYERQASVLEREWFPVMSSLGESIASLAEEEVAGDRALEQRAVSEADREAFIQRLVRSFAEREVASSEGQLRQILREANLEDVEDEVIERLEEWEESRPNVQAIRNSTETASAVAKLVWATLGVSAIVWVANADACPICQEMDGRTVEITGHFASPGDTVDPGDGETTPLETKKFIGHPPLHKGCVCNVSPA